MEQILDRLKIGRVVQLTDTERSFTLALLNEVSEKANFAIISRHLSNFVFYEVNEHQSFLSALRSAMISLKSAKCDSKSAIVVIFIDHTVLIEISEIGGARAVRLASIIGGFSVLIVSSNQNLSWPDDVEGRFFFNVNDQCINDSSLFPLFFK